jgi:hypothetical protein
MKLRSHALALALFLAIEIFLAPFLYASPAASWSGVLRDSAGNPVGMAIIKLVSREGSRGYSATTSTSGQFAFAAIAASNYTLTISAEGQTWTATDPVVIKEGSILTSGLQFSAQSQELRVVVAREAASPQASGGEHL